ncbi:MAG: glycoside hydrolase family 32 protein [Bryobacteraceae bacterium]
MIVALGWGAILAAAPPEPPGYYSEPFRPQFHFTPEKNWMNDPNGLVYYQGEYHLFYQYNPFGNTWGHMSWGHAVSSDLVHWKHLPPALPEADGVMIFSGSAVVDWKNSSGFGKNGKPPMVAVYTCYRPSDRMQSQCIAFSNDKGRTWTKYASNPVIDIHSTNFRDPKVQWYEPGRHWIMTVSLSDEHKVRFYSSTNLKDWALLSEFGPAGGTAGVWECPDLFQLAVEGTREKRWVLIVNINPGSIAGGSGGQYFIGQFDGTRFVEDPGSRSAAGVEGQAALWFDYGPDYYAAVSWNDVPRADGRRLWLGWMSNWHYGQDVPTTPWRSAMSIAREVGLRQTAEGIRLVQRPAKENQKLREKRFQFQGGDLTRANEWLAQNHVQGAELELVVEFERQNTGVQGVEVLKTSQGATVIGVNWDRQTVFVDRTKSGNVNFNPKFSGLYDAPLLAPGRRVNLHVFIDASSVEVFVNDGERVLTAISFPSGESREVKLIGPQDHAKIGALDIWRLKSSWK